MNSSIRIAAFTGALALTFGGAALAGGAIDPDRGSEKEGHADVKTHEEPTHGAKQQPVRGLGVAEDGLRVVVEDPELRRGETERLRFRVVDARGATVKDFSVEHEKRMHLIIARRDLANFQHLHPVQASDGSWSTDVELDDAGSYRLFADFARDGETTTLAADLRVDGRADLKPLPAPATAAKSDGGYDVTLDRHGDELGFSISRNGKSVKTESYLGAGGHLVALREGDLAFLHVHPDEHRLTFTTKFPTAGRYRLFLQFKHEGRVHTVAFTQEKK
jgi:hypothetical protein